LLIPSAAGEPYELPIADQLRVRRDAPHEFIRRRRIAQLHARELKAAVDEVNVIVDEAGKREAAVQIDDACAVRNGGIDGGDAIALDDDIRGEPRAGPDPAVGENERCYSPSLICAAR
jgi:hypothetical protein